MLICARWITFISFLREVYMGCPYFDEVYIGTCGLASKRNLPSIEQMEKYCVRQNYRLCPELMEHMYENDMAMANRRAARKLYRRKSLPLNCQAEKM